MNSSENPSMERPFELKGRDQMELDAKKEIEEALVLSPFWKDISPDEQRQLIDDIFERTAAIFLSQREDQFEQRKAA